MAWDEAITLLSAAGRDLEVVDALMGLDESYYTIGDKIFKRLSDSSIVSMAVCTPSDMILGRMKTIRFDLVRLVLRVLKASPMMGMRPRKGTRLSMEAAMLI